MLNSFLRKIYRKIFSEKIRITFRSLFKFCFYKLRFLKLKILLIFSDDVNLILGAALTSQDNWISTNEEWLDISNEKDWYRLFKNQRKVKKALAEHVFEHLTKDEMRNALKLIKLHLVENGTLRITIPDGNNPNPLYRKYAGINGIGADASDHKQFITFESLEEELKKIGFKCKLIQGYTKDGDLINNHLSITNGYIMRSRSESAKKINKSGWEFPDSNTSLIVDAYL